MIESQIYIMIVVLVLLIIGLITFFKNKNKLQKLSPLANIALVFVLVGILFRENIVISYVLMGIGVILAIVDIFLKRGKNEKKSVKKKKRR